MSDDLPQSSNFREYNILTPPDEIRQAKVNLETKTALVINANLRIFDSLLNRQESAQLASLKQNNKLSTFQSVTNIKPWFNIANYNTGKAIIPSSLFYASNNHFRESLSNVFQVPLPEKYILSSGQNTGLSDSTDIESPSKPPELVTAPDPHLHDVPFIYVQTKQHSIPTETRLKYVVRAGDTLESIAGKILYDPSLARLIYEINKLKISVKIKDGKKLLQLKEKSILFLPTKTEIKFFKRKFFGKFIEKFEYDTEDIMALDSSITIIDQKKNNQTPNSTSINQLNLPDKETRQRINTQKYTYKCPDDCCIISYINIDKLACLICLKYQQKEKWLPVIVYRIEEDLSNRYEYNMFGLSKKTKIDLPPKQVRQLANNDLTNHWKDYLQKYELPQ